MKNTDTHSLQQRRIEKHNPIKPSLLEISSHVAGRGRRLISLPTFHKCVGHDDADVQRRCHCQQLEMDKSVTLPEISLFTSHAHTTAQHQHTQRSSIRLVIVSASLLGNRPRGRWTRRARGWSRPPRRLARDMLGRWWRSRRRKQRTSERRGGSGISGVSCDAGRSAHRRARLMTQFFEQLSCRLLQQMELCHANPSSLKLARPRVKDPLCGCGSVSHEGSSPHSTGGPLGYDTDPLAVVVAQRKNRCAEPHLAPGLNVH